MKSLDSGEFPQDWKTVTFTQMFKKGSRTKAGNYRPVSLTCISCKIHEIIKREKMLDHEKDTNTLDQNKVSVYARKVMLDEFI